MAPTRAQEQESDPAAAAAGEAPAEQGAETANGDSEPKTGAAVEHSAEANEADASADTAQAGSDGPTGTSQSPKKGGKNGKSKKGSKSKGKSNSPKSSRSNGSTGSSEEREAGPVAEAGSSNEAEEGEIKEETSAADDRAEHQGAKDDSAGSAAPRREASTSSDGSGSKPKRPRSSSTNKELAQLGLGSFGDAAEEVTGPRRTRRAPNGSPDPKQKRGEDAAEEGANPEQVPKQEEVETVVGEAQEAPASQDVVMEEAEYADAGTEAALDPEGGDEGVTRCVCGSADENVGLMIQCETCKCWQHCVCMGMQFEEDCPDVYFCEQCKPELHIPLLRSFGLLPHPRGGKKGSKSSSKYSARELNQAKESIAALAQANARRNQAEAIAAYATPPARERRQGSHSRTDSEHKQQTPKSPKRRSTMNSRDSAYSGWEPIPPGLLNDGESWESAEAQTPQDDKRGAKKRKRGSTDDGDEKDSALTPDPADDASATPAELAKRRRMSAGGFGQNGDDENGDEHGDRDMATTTRDKSKKKKGGSGAARDAAASESRPRHPNQYTYRNKDRNAAANGLGGKGGSTSASNLTSHSPSPSPSKSRAEAARRSAREAVGTSRTGTPAPGDSGASGSSRTYNPGAPWGLPDHLAHLAYLLPISISRPQSSHGSGSKGATSSSNARRVAAANAAAAAAAASAPSPSASGTPSGPPVGASPSSPNPYTVMSAIEATTKVRFPGRRMTLAEMRKRVRNIGEYVTRSQIEAVDREKRMRLLGIVPDYLTEELDENGDGDDADAADDGDAGADELGSGGKQSGPHSRASTAKASGGEGEGGASSSSSSGATTKAPPTTAATPQPPAGDGAGQAPPLTPQDDAEGGDEKTATPTVTSSAAGAAGKGTKSLLDNLPLSMRLMDELTRELIHFQRKFGSGPGAYGSVGSGGGSGSGGGASGSNGVAT